MAYRLISTLYNGDQKLQRNIIPTDLGPDPPMRKQKQD